MKKNMSFGETVRLVFAVATEVDLARVSNFYCTHLGFHQVLEEQGPASKSIVLETPSDLGQFQLYFYYEDCRLEDKRLFALGDKFSLMLRCRHPDGPRELSEKLTVAAIAHEFIDAESSLWVSFKDICGNSIVALWQSQKWGGSA